MREAIREGFESDCEDLSCWARARTRTPPPPTHPLTHPPTHTHTVLGMPWVYHKPTLRRGSY